MKDNDNFLWLAAACFRSALLHKNLLLGAAAGLAAGTGKLFSAAGLSRQTEEPILDPVSICSYTASKYCFLFKQGADWPCIFHNFKNDKSLAEAWKILNCLQGPLGLEQVLAIFIIWNLQKEDQAERHRLRPLVYEIRKVDKEIIAVIRIQLDEWLGRGEERCHKGGDK